MEEEARKVKAAHFQMKQANKKIVELNDAAEERDKELKEEDLH